MSALPFGHEYCSGGLIKRYRKKGFDNFQIPTPDDTIGKYRVFHLIDILLCASRTVSSKPNKDGYKIAIKMPPDCCKETYRKNLKKLDCFLRIYFDGWEIRDVNDNKVNIKELTPLANK